MARLARLARLGETYAERTETNLVEAVPCRLGSWRLLLNLGGGFCIISFDLYWNLAYRLPLMLLAVVR